MKRHPFVHLSLALFFCSAAGLIGAPCMQAQAPAAAAPLTAGEAVARIQAALHVTLPSDTVDTIKAGDAATPVTGIVTTFTPTMQVLRQAVALHANLVVTHEPSFYNHRDEKTLFATDPVLAEKLAYIREHNLVLFRLHDGWHQRRPDGIAEGWVRQMGWAAYRKPGTQYFFTVPATTVLGLAKDVEQRSGAQVVRVVGDPSMPVTQVAYAPGSSGEAKQVRALEMPDVEVLVAGESSEWETVEYVRDAMQQGRHKALILVGHDRSEEGGMDECAQWLRTVLPGVPAIFVPAGEPYWSPERPRGAIGPAAP